MRTQSVAIALTVALAVSPCLGQSTSVPQSVEQKIRATPTDSPVELRLLDGSKLRGWVSEISPSGFTLTQEQKGRLEKRQVAFQDAKSVKQVKSVKPSHTGRNILIGAGIALAAVTIVMVSLVKAAGYL